MNLQILCALANLIAIVGGARVCDNNQVEVRIRYSPADFLYVR